MAIESLKTEIDSLPITPTLLASLQESARLMSTHYSTMIEGNRLTQKEVVDLIVLHKKIAGRERDEKEVLGYYAALDYIQEFSLTAKSITEHTIKKIHALVMGGGKTNVKPDEYRDGQNVIKDSRSGTIVYLPPEAADVPHLMHDVVAWINKQQITLPYPLLAGIAHYQFATIHPYYDGNGRTARLLVNAILRMGHYDLQGIYSLDEYYAKNLQSYYNALAIGPSHNYYMGRETADITPWVAYFIEGMLQSFKNIKKHAAVQAQKMSEQSVPLRTLAIKKKKILAAADKNNIFTSKDIQQLLHVSDRTARLICQQLVADKFFTVVDASKKNRLYAINL